MQFKYFIGIDVSKKTLDLSLVKDTVVVSHVQLSNNPKSIKTGIKTWFNANQINYQESLFCMEDTGVYNYPVLEWLSSQKAFIWVQSAIEIKKSMGVVRGKNDKIDAARIALYAMRNKDKLRLWEAPKAELKKLARLLALRDKLVKTKKQLSLATDLDGFIEKDLVKELKAEVNPVIKEMDKRISALDKKMKDIINSDEELKRIYIQSTSVPGVGPITAFTLIVKTGEFKRITDPKKLACYCGVVPFEHSSGTSIRTKARVSHMADKDLKTLLHLVACCAMQHDEHLRNYYQRKLLEGKPKLLVINAIRNKIIHRVYACVMQNRNFQKTFDPLLHMS